MRTKRNRGAPKLNLTKVRQIRERFAAGERTSSLAAHFGVSYQAIRDIVNFETWVDAGGPKVIGSETENSSD